MLPGGFPLPRFSILVQAPKMKANQPFQFFKGKTKTVRRHCRWRIIHR
jgi:hypothetical protein